LPKKSKILTVSEDEIPLLASHDVEEVLPWLNDIDAHASRYPKKSISSDVKRQVAKARKLAEEFEITNLEYKETHGDPKKSEILVKYQRERRKYEKYIDPEIREVKYLWEEMRMQTDKSRFTYRYDVVSKTFYYISKSNEGKYKFTKEINPSRLCDAYYRISPNAGQIPWKDVAAKLGGKHGTPTREDMRLYIKQLKEWTTHKDRKMGEILKLEGEYIKRLR